MKQSFAWWTYNNRGVEDEALLKGAKEIGYDAVELISPDKFQMALDAGLAIASHGGHKSLVEGLNNPANHDGIEQEVTAMLETAVQFAIPNLIVFSGNRIAGESDEAGAEHTAAGLRRIAPLAEQAGVTLIIELLNSKVDHAGYQCDHTDWAVGVVKAVESPRVKALYDIYHMQIMEGDIIRTIQANYDHFGHYHTAGNPGRHDLDDDQEILYPPIIRTIANTGYMGYICHEFTPKGDPIAALSAAYELTQNAMESTEFNR